MKRFSLLLVLCCIVQLTAAQNGFHSFRFRHHTVENGLSANSVRTITQDRKGFIWFGTDSGLNCFDGIQIKDFNPGRTDGPGSRAISSLYEDTDGIIWVATDEDIYLYDPSKDIFTCFDILTTKHEKLTGIISNIMQDKDLNLWFSSYGRGIFKYDKKNKELTRYTPTDGCNNIYYVYADSENAIWAAGNSSALYKLNKTNQVFERFAVYPEKGKQFSNTLAIFEDVSNNLWLGTWNTGVQKLDRYTGELTAYLSPATGKGVMHIHSICEYSNQLLLVGSDDGLSLLNKATGEHHLFVPDELNPYSLTDKFIYPIVKDKEGGIWIGTYYGGVNYLSPRTGQFEGFISSKHSNSVGGNIVNRFCEDAKGNIWIASDDGGLSRYSPATGLFSNYLPQEGRNSLSYHNIHALCFDGDDLWIGTYSAGLNVLNTQTGKFRYYHTDEYNKYSLDQGSIYALFKDRSDNMWIATMMGINLYDRKNDRFERVKTLDATTIDINQDANGYVWFATQGKGLLRYNPANKSWKTYQQASYNDGQAVNFINHINIDTYGDMWVGTANGLYKYKPAEDIFEKIPLSIPNPNILCIIEDQHSLWITTSKGLLHYIPGEGSLLFTKSDGLQSDLFLPSAGLKASDGKIYVGTASGFNAFYPHRIKRNNFLPPVVLTGLEVLNKGITVSEDGILPAPLHMLKQIDLTYRDNAFSILYAALSYSIPEKNTYSYKLEGFDKDWNYVDTQNKATYTSLPAGTYTFKVRASNNDGTWNDEGASLRIVIHPPFYLTTSFKIVYLVIAVFAFLFIIRFFTKRTQKKHAEEIAELNRQKEKEMHEAKISFFTIIAHEIRTPVSLIIGPLEKILNKAANLLPEDMLSDLNVIDRNSQRLLSLVNQLLDFRKVEREGMHLKLERANIYELLRAVTDRFIPYIEQRGAKFTMNCLQEDIQAVVDKEAITKLVSNLLTNASKYTKDSVSLSCRFIENEKLFYLTVEDNGCGISKEDQEKIFQPFYQAADNKPGTGIGLSIVNTIIQAHGGTIEVQSEPGKGCMFIVCLPTEQPILAEDAEMPPHEQPATKLPEDILSEITASHDNRVKPVMLIVDDNDEMLNFLSASFADEYSIITAEDGQEALKKLKRQEVALIVSDWMMPKVSGVELCKAIRSNPTTSHIPFILLTAKADVHSKIEGMDCGADTYIEKPFSVQYLKSCIKNLIDLRAMLYQKYSKMPGVPIKSIAANKADEKFLTRMNEIIEENFANPDLSIEDLADQLCISRSGLFAKIKTLTNVTPNELIQVVRLKKAASMLSEGEYRVNEICYMVGFNNPSYFSKCFQKQFGVKPGEYVKKISGE